MLRGFNSFVRLLGCYLSIGPTPYGPVKRPATVAACQQWFFRIGLWKDSHILEYPWADLEHMTHIWFISSSTSTASRYIDIWCNLDSKFLTLNEDTNIDSWYRLWSLVWNLRGSFSVDLCRDFCWILRTPGRRLWLCLAQSPFAKFGSDRLTTS